MSVDPMPPAGPRRRRRRLSAELLVFLGFLAVVIVSALATFVGRWYGWIR